MFSRRPQLDVGLEKIKVLFTYDLISTAENPICDNDDIPDFVSQRDSTAFIKLSYFGTDPRFSAKPPFAKGGWKLHIAIDDVIPGNVARAWNIIKDILIEERISTSKVIKPGESFVDDVTQCGKQITIYQFFNPERNWGVIINEIEGRLLSAGIVPAPEFSPTDRPIIGSRYITYRNDLSENGRFVIDSRKAMSYQESTRFNPFNRPDPFANIRISHQPEPSSSSSSSSSITP